MASTSLQVAVLPLSLFMLLAAGGKDPSIQYLRFLAFFISSAISAFNTRKVPGIWRFVLFAMCLLSLGFSRDPSTTIDFLRSILGWVVACIGAGNIWRFELPDSFCKPIASKPPTPKEQENTALRSEVASLVVRLSRSETALKNEIEITDGQEKAMIEDHDLIREQASKIRALEHRLAQRNQNPEQCLTCQ